MMMSPDSLRDVCDIGKKIANTIAGFNAFSSAEDKILPLKNQKHTTFHSAKVGFCAWWRRPC
jgi:hypothetical protein